MLVAGLGLGALVYTLSRLDAFLPQTGMPKTPATLLDHAVPLLGNAAGMPAAVMMNVALVAIPMLVVAGITPRWPLRALIAIIIVALVGTAAFGFEPATDSAPLRAILLVVGAAVVMFALYAWGSLCAWSWIVAALAQQVLSGLRFAVHAPTAPEQAAGALMLAVACALVALIARRTRSS